MHTLSLTLRKNGEEKVERRFTEGQAKIESDTVCVALCASLGILFKVVAMDRQISLGHSAQISSASQHCRKNDNTPVETGGYSSVAAILVSGCC